MKKLINQKTQLPMLAALLCIIIMIASIFLPYVTAVDEYKEFLEAAEQQSSLSLFDFAKVFLEQDIPAVAVVLGMFAGFSALAALLAVFRKPIGVMLFNILAAAVAVLTYTIFAHDGTLADGYYTWGIGDRMIFVGCAGLFICAIWMLVAKIGAKKKFTAINK